MWWDIYTPAMYRRQLGDDERRNVRRALRHTPFQRSTSRFGDNFTIATVNEMAELWIDMTIVHTYILQARQRATDPRIIERMERDEVHTERMATALSRVVERSDQEEDMLPDYASVLLYNKAKRLYNKMARRYRVPPPRHGSGVVADRELTVEDVAMLGTDMGILQIDIMQAIGRETNPETRVLMGRDFQSANSRLGHLSAMVANEGALSLADVDVYNEAKDWYNSAVERYRA
jgi:hypothetical protein